jgi:hypothetical protein
MKKEPESNAWKKRKKMAADSLEKAKTKTVTIEWTEFHNYEAEIEIPTGMTEGESIGWIILNTDKWGMNWREPYEINPDYDSFEIVKES